MTVNPTLPTQPKLKHIPPKSRGQAGVIMRKDHQGTQLSDKAATKGTGTDTPQAPASSSAPSHPYGFNMATVPSSNMLNGMSTAQLTSVGGTAEAIVASASPNAIVDTNTSAGTGTASGSSGAQAPQYAFEYGSLRPTLDPPTILLYVEGLVGRTFKD